MNLLVMLALAGAVVANAGKLKSLINYTKNTVVQAEVNEITKMILLEKIDGKEAPTEAQFPAFLKKNMRIASGKSERDVTKDQFGNPYRVEYQNNHVRVISAGADGVFGSNDDIYSERSLNGI